jgi:hypothetical protein
VTIQQELLASIYLDAKEYVIRSGYVDELDWQVQLSFADVTESQFLSEAAWVILSSGFREAIVRKCFPSISEAFLNWESANIIVQNMQSCKSRGLHCFGNRRKIDAICVLTATVSREGFEQVKRNIRDYGLDYLRSYPYIGPVTGKHLLKNLGLYIAKPDRHLIRIAKALGFDSPQELCDSIEQITGDSTPEIDLVLWRYATIKQNYLGDLAVGWR